MVDKQTIDFVSRQYSFFCIRSCGSTFNLEAEVRDGVVVCPNCDQSEPIAEMKPERIDSGDTDTYTFKIRPTKFTSVRHG